MLSLGELVHTNEIIGLKHYSPDSISLNRIKRRRGWNMIFTKHFTSYIKDL